ncbi:MAG TPA: lamin tail domain-containing protein [Vicinamibacterales bacterium]|nr:lamin tail domain-containing protein [Vicinamibacterales bacterium]
MHSKSARLTSLVLFLMSVMAGLPRAEAQQPSAAELFFSEYVEGSSNNKALEIYNGTAAPIDLQQQGYNVQMHFNGNPVATLTISLTGTVAAGDVFILAHSSAVLPVPADQTNGAGWFNGDDAVVLRKGAIVIDVIGQIGFDPGTEWGTGLTSTADNSLRRKCTVTAGDTNGSDVFDPSLEWDGFATNTFDGLGVHCGAAPPPPPPPLLAIHEIQGSGAASPHAGVIIETLGNIVTAVGAQGFFIQTPEVEADADPATSQGIYVFTSTAPTVQIGDMVDVKGSVAEFFSLTEITSPAVTVVSGGHALPAPVLFTSANPSPSAPSPEAALERYEGMLVRIEDGVATGPTNQFGETPVVAGATRAFREPGILAPGLPGLPVWDGNPEIVEVDFGGLGQPDVQVFGGTRIAQVEGPLSFSFGDYQIWPTSFERGFEPTLPRAVRAKARGELTVATQNFLRLYDTIDDPAVDDDVETPEAYAVRLAKVSKYIREILGSPDILAVQEVENFGVLRDVAVQIAADDSSVHYAPYLAEGNDIGGIDVGFLVRDTVIVDGIEQFGASDVFEFGAEVSLLNDRPPLVLRGAYVGDGAPFPFVLINVHQRSLSGVEGADGRVRAKRHEQALRLSKHIQAIQTTDPDVRLIVLGDFNAFEFTDGYVDVMGQVTGLLDSAGALLPGTDEVEPDLTNQTFNMPAEERYSFVFDGTAQSLDHVLTSQAVEMFVRGVEHARGNADAFPSAGDDETTALRAADHDGTVLFLMTIPLDKDECKNDGWQRFTGAFRNQGQCVSFVESNRPR